MRALGTILLGIGFTTLAVAILIRDPSALDANIGAGLRSLIGIPIGAVGLVLVVIHAVVSRWHPSN